MTKLLRRWSDASIQVKLSSVIVALVVAVAALLAGGLTARHVRDLDRSLTRKAETYGLLVARGVASAVAFDDRQTAREVFESVAVDESVHAQALYGTSGTLLEALGDLQAPVAKRTPPDHPTMVRRDTVIEMVVPVVSVEGPRGTLVLQLGTEALAAGRRRAVLLAIGWGLAAAIAGLCAAWFIARSFSRRIGSLSQAASAVAGGDLGQRPVVDPSRDELGQLTAAFNAMWAKIKDLLAHIQRSAREEAERLEGLVRQRTAELDGRNAEMRLVLDNIEQGFVTVDRQGRFAAERSRILDVWFGAPGAAETLWDWIAPDDEALRGWLQTGWQAMSEDILPVEVTADQLPKRLEVGGCCIELSYKPIGWGSEGGRMLVVMTDVTARQSRERAEEAQREFANLVERFYRDRAAVQEFFAESRRLVAAIAAPGSVAELARAVHTLKGNTAMVGLDGVARLCNELEGRMAEHGGVLDEAGTRRLVTRWAEEETRFACLAEESLSRRIEVDVEEYQQALEAVKRGASTPEIVRLLEWLRYEPVERRLTQLAEQAERLAGRLDKAPVRVSVASGQVRLPPRALAEFWTSCVHVVRNAVDHGIETSAARQAAGKPETAEIALSARFDGDVFEVAVEDSGRGIDWEAVRASAVRAGHPSDTADQLMEALFANGITTRDVATEISGRGIGMGAVRGACESSGGVVLLDSKLGVGTRVRFRWPASRVGALRGSAAASASATPGPRGTPRGKKGGSIAA